MPIAIIDYRPAWPVEFDVVRAHLATALGALALRIDHIGSTSVPGLGAKDVIDIQVTVLALSAEVASRLVAAGYVRRDAITHDHVPPGEDPSPALWAKLLFYEIPGTRRANIHVRSANQPNQRYALVFRDYLRQHPASAQAIDRIKRELAARLLDDEDAYYAIKDPVYDLVWDAARRGT